MTAADQSTRQENDRRQFTQIPFHPELMGQFGPLLDGRVLALARAASAARHRPRPLAMHAPPKRIAADHPILLPDGLLLGVRALQEISPQTLSSRWLRGQLLIPGVGRQQSIGLTSGISPASRLLVVPPALSPARLRPDSPRCSDRKSADSSRPHSPAFCPAPETSGRPGRSVGDSAASRQPATPPATVTCSSV
jgi:hypothetical protein